MAYKICHLSFSLLYLFANDIVNWSQNSFDVLQNFIPWGGSNLHLCDERFSKYYCFREKMQYINQNSKFFKSLFGVHENSESRNYQLEWEKKTSIQIIQWKKSVACILIIKQHAPGAPIFTFENWLKIKKIKFHNKIQACFFAKMS